MKGSNMFQITTIPEQYKKEFQQLLFQENYRRFLIFGTLFFFYEIFIYFSLSSEMDSSYLSTLAYIIFAQFLMLAIFFYGYIKSKNTYHMIFATLFHAALLMILSWTIWFTMVIQQSSDRITPYVLGIFTIAAVAYLRPLFVLVMYNGCFIAFIYLLPKFQTNTTVIFPHILNGLFLNIVAIMLSIMLYNFRKNVFLNRQIIEEQNHILTERSLRDPMTQLYNHQYSYEKLQEEIDRSKRYKTPLTVLLVDLDYFKEVNDRFGHIYGDEVLESVANIMKATMRSTDLIGRYGGEEFIIILPHTGIADAFTLGERLRTRIQERSFPQDHHITISGGMCQYTNETAHQLIEKADRLLYKAKNSGRNQIAKQDA